MPKNRLGSKCAAWLLILPMLIWTGCEPAAEPRMEDPEEPEMPRAVEQPVAIEEDQEPVAPAETAPAPTPEGEIAAPPLMEPPAEPTPELGRAPEHPEHRETPQPTDTPEAPEQPAEEEEPSY